MTITKVPDVKPPTPGQAIRVTVAGAPIAVFNRDGQLFAIDARCTHVGGPLERGLVSSHVVTCPLHGSQFDLATGAVVRGPAMKPVRTYKVHSEEGALLLETD